MKRKHENIYQVHKNLATTYYYKNGKLHREIGPAIVISGEEKYNNLGDENLYQSIDYPILDCDNKIINKITLIVIDLMRNYSEYYLDGIRYTKSEFDVLMLKKELQEQLETNKKNDKKLKI